MRIIETERTSRGQRWLRVLFAEPPLRLFMRSLLKGGASLFPDHIGLFESAAHFDALPYTAYAVGLQIAARYALRAGQPGFTAIEFGVAGGNGLLAMTRYAKLVSRLTGLKIKVVGFDAGQGLPERNDFRDAPWHWNAGDFPCQVETLRARIPETQLIVGPIEGTFPQWLAECEMPIGFMSVDVDYYSSTRAICATLANAPVETLLPMIECYFDDCLRYLVPRNVGEAAAIAEFNATSATRFFDRDDWLAEDRPYGERLWLRRMYTHYCLDHPSMQVHRNRDVERLDLIAS